MTESAQHGEPFQYWTVQDSSVCGFPAQDTENDEQRLYARDACLPVSNPRPKKWHARVREGKIHLQNMDAVELRLDPQT